MWQETHDKLSIYYQDNHTSILYWYTAWPNGHLYANIRGKAMKQLPANWTIS